MRSRKSSGRKNGRWRMLQLDADWPMHFRLLSQHKRANSEHSLVATPSLNRVFPSIRASSVGGLLMPVPAAVDRAISRAGIAEGKDGQRHIPSSVRADGTVRKEIRVRDGYRPPEDVDVYKNRTADAFKNRGKAGVPGAQAVEGTDGSAAATGKNAKRREARRKAASTAGGPTEQSHDDDTIAIAPTEPVEPVDPETERAKEARKLSKKLRQARELKDKKDQGDSLLPEQFEKVIKINELIRQLDKLGFDADGERKPDST